MAYPSNTIRHVDVFRFKFSLFLFIEWGIIVALCISTG